MPSDMNRNTRIAHFSSDVKDFLLVIFPYIRQEMYLLSYG